MLALSAKAALGELIYKFKTRGLPENSQVEKMRQEFKSYQYRPAGQPLNKELVS
jgi:hypothetical protein